jgi:hypothetical protein
VDLAAVGAHCALAEQFVVQGTLTRDELVAVLPAVQMSASRGHQRHRAALHNTSEFGVDLPQRSGFAIRSLRNEGAALIPRLLY